MCGKKEHLASKRVNVINFYESIFNYNNALNLKTVYCDAKKISALCQITSMLKFKIILAKLVLFNSEYIPCVVKFLRTNRSKLSKPLTL